MGKQEKTKISSLFKRDAQEYKATVILAGFLCVWAFIAIGTCRSLFDLILAESEQFPSWKALTAAMQLTLLQRVKTAFIVLTGLCIINMKIICRMTVIKQHLGNADLKFLGTRLLILVKETLF